MSRTELFEDDRYLQPALDDDPLLYSFEDIEDGITSDTAQNTSYNDPRDNAGDQSTFKRILQLQEEIERLQSQFMDYRLAVQQTALQAVQQESEPEASNTSSTNKDGKQDTKASEDKKLERGYFSSYAENSELRNYATFILYLQDFSNPRDHAQGYRPYGRLSGFHL